MPALRLHKHFLIMDTLELRDTLTRERRLIVAEDGSTLRLYCCGPTVYGPAHIGNFRTFLVQDLFRRVVELTGLPVKHVRNITDVDDKTIRESQAAGKSLKEFTDHWVERLHVDCAAMNMLTPHLEPSAVEHIAEQITLIETLVEKGHAYQGADGSVYFKVSSFEDYGSLSGLKDRELKMGASDTANDADEYEKESLADFALWKSRKPEDGDNFWNSPWGEGRPGWHLECSAMSMKHLGETFDVHGGGVDLIFPHHENEIAQSEACTCKPFVRHWFHSEHLMVEGGKMAKSSGTMYTLSDLVEKGYSPAEVRFALLAGSYRQKLNFKEESLNAARLNLTRIAELVARLREVGSLEFSVGSHEELVAEVKGGARPQEMFEEAWKALLDDLNTPKALGAFFSRVKDFEKSEVSAEDAGKALRGILFFVDALGVQLPEVVEAEAADVPEDVKALAEQRLEAKSNKDWATSDALRDQIKEMGWILKDTKDGYELEKG